MLSMKSHGLSCQTSVHFSFSRAYSIDSTTLVLNLMVSLKRYGFTSPFTRPRARKASTSYRFVGRHVALVVAQQMREPSPVRIRGISVSHTFSYAKRAWLFVSANELITGVPQLESLHRSQRLRSNRLGDGKEQRDPICVSWSRGSKPAPTWKGNASIDSNHLQQRNVHDLWWHLASTAVSPCDRKRQRR